MLGKSQSTTTAVDATPCTSAQDDTPSTSSASLDVDFTPSTGNSTVPADQADTLCSSAFTPASENSCESYSPPSGTGLLTNLTPLQGTANCQKCSQSSRKKKTMQRKHNRLTERFKTLEKKYNDLLSQQVGDFWEGLVNHKPTCT